MILNLRAINLKYYLHLGDYILQLIYNLFYFERVIIVKYGDIVVYGNSIGSIVFDSGVNKFTENGVARFLPMKYGRYYASDLKVVTDNDVREATDDEKIIFIKSLVDWLGTIEKVHVIEDYQIVEINGKRDRGKLFSVFLNFKHKNASYLSLESAMIGAIAAKFELDNRVVDFVGKMMGLDHYEEGLEIAEKLSQV